jgi:tyrosinase
MPMPGPNSWVYTPQQVNSLSQLNYNYENFASLPKCVPPSVQLAGRLAKLGASIAAEKVKAGTTVNIGRKVELVGASQGAVKVKGSMVQTSVKFDPTVRNKVSTSLAAASETAPPDRIFLNLENIQGTQNATVLAVYLNLPEGANPNDHPELLAGSVGLFGLRGASAPDGRHGGQGLSFTLEITNIVDALHLDNKLNQDSLQVTVVPSRPLPELSPITIGRISIYRKGN